MRQLIFVFISCFFFNYLNGQQLNPDYDSLIARRLGADDYGMKNYILVILKKGTNNMQSGERLDSLMNGHLNNITRLARERKLLVAGPLGKNEKSYNGIFILNVKTFEEACKLLETDPAIKEKIFDTELYLWYGSAALGEYLEIDRKAGRYRF